MPPSPTLSIPCSAHNVAINLRFSRNWSLFHANMKAKCAIKGLLRAHAARDQQRKYFHFSLHFAFVATTKCLMQIVHKHQLYAVTQNAQSAKQQQKEKQPWNAQTQKPATLAQFAFNRAETKTFLRGGKLTFENSHENLRESAFCRTIKSRRLKARKQKVIFDFHHDCAVGAWKL